MKKLYMTIFFLTGTFISAESNYLTQEQIRALSNSHKVLANSYTRIVEGIDEPETYFLDLQLKGKSANAFVDKKTGAVYIGNRYTKDGKKSKFVKSPKRMAKLTKAVQKGISFSYGSGKKDLYIFTDPECPYCKKFEKQSNGLLGDYKVHVLLYPLAFHKSAPAMTEWIMRGDNDMQRHKRMEEVMIGGSKKYKDLSSDPSKRFKYSSTIQLELNRAKQAVRLLGVRGTPTLFDANFIKINWGKFLRQERVRQRKKLKK